MARTDERLTTEQDWDQAWAETAIDDVRFDPTIPIFRDIHRVISSSFAPDSQKRFLEIGAYPGHLMWYFHKYFGYRTSGIEFVPRCCELTQTLLDKEGVDAELIQADVFDFVPQPSRELWDLVASQGLIEHFADVGSVIDQHVRLAKPQGHVMLIVPNHTGVYGRIMRFLRPDKYVLHTRISLPDVVTALHQRADVHVIFSAIRRPTWVLELLPLRNGQALGTSSIFPSAGTFVGD